MLAPASRRGVGASSRNAALLPVALAVVLASGGLGAGCTRVAEQPDLSGQDVPLTVIHTSDLHSRFFPYEFAPGQIDKNLGLVPTKGNIAIVGGVARIATVIKDIRESTDRVIHIDSGDIFQGAPVFNVFGGEVEMRAMAQLGLSAMALGNHEFDRGAMNLYLMKQQYGHFPILAANYVFTDPNDPTQPKLGRIIYPFTILNVAGLRVGVIGMGNLSSLQGIYEGGNSLGIRPLETSAVVRDTVRTLRGSVDLLVLTTHLGLEVDEVLAQQNSQGVDENQQAAIEGVDVIFGGHLHIVLNPPNRIEHDDGTFTVICHSGAFAKYIGRLDLTVHVPDKKIEEQKLPCTTKADCAVGVCDKDRKICVDKPRVKSFAYDLLPITDAIPEDPDMQDMLEPYRVKMNLRLNLSEKYAIVPCPDTAGTCPKVLRNDPNGGDSQLGNMVARAMRLRQRVEADFALTNSLGIRADFESGPLDLEQMYNVFPFDNSITTMFLSGKEIQEMLDFLAARAGERGCRSQAQVSGIWYVADCTNKVSCGPYDAQGNLASRCHAEDRSAPPDQLQDGPYLIGDDCRRHPENCRPILPFHSYRVAVNDYIANGGSGFNVLKRNTTKFNTGISLRDALIDYIRTLDSRCTRDGYTNLVGDDFDFRSLPCLVPEGVEGHDERILMVSP